MISDNMIDACQDANVYNVISHYGLKLNKTGKLYTACCPFHGEKTPSFQVNPAKNNFICRGCGISGNAITFVMKHDNLDFIDACQKVASIENIPIELKKKELSEDEKQKVSLMQQQEKAVNITIDLHRAFAKKLPDSHPAKIKMLQRFFDEETIDQWHIGFSGSKYDNVASQLINKNLYAAAIAAGIIKTRDEKTFDKFIDYITFPIKDKNGRYAGIAGMAVSTEKKQNGFEPVKYLNTCSSELFDKSALLFGMHEAKNAITKKGFVYLVEGYTDVISCHHVGLENTVGLMSKELTEKHLKLLNRYTNTVVLFLDNDSDKSKSPGIEATKKIIPVLLANSFNVYRAVYTGDDPDKFVVESINNGITEIKPEQEDALIWLCEQKIKNATTAAEKAGAKEDVYKLLNVIPNEILRNQYLIDVIEHFGWNSKETKNEFISFSKNNSGKVSPNPTDSTQPKPDKHLPLIVQVERFLNERFEFRRNAVNGRIELKKKATNEDWALANENQLSRLLEHNYFRFSAMKTASLLSSDFVQEFNPFIDYFQSLTYDAQNEISYIDKLCTMVRTVHEIDQERFAKHFKKMLVRCVACSTTTEIMNSKFNKHVFVLIKRGQSVGKTSFIRWLCPPALTDYYVENPSMDKDGTIALATSFFINLDELASISKQDINVLKAKISMASINERLPFARTRQFYPRRANFFGSSNNDQFLTDDTGNVRWLCFEIDRFEQNFWLPGAANFIDINKVWAEAKHLFDTGYNYQLTNEERNDNEDANKRYEQISIEEEIILSYFSIDPHKEKINFMTSTEVFQFITLQNGINASKISVQKIGAVLKKIGFQRGQERKNGSHPVQGYYLRKLPFTPNQNV